MTVSSDLNRISYTGNGTTTVFPVNYYFLEDSHLQVVLITAAGVETIQTLTTNYTVTGAGNEAGGSVTMLVAPPVGTTLVIQREVPATQETDYLANDPFPAESHERALDKLTMLVQQNERELDRALKIPLASVPTTSTELPLPVGNKLLAWNSNATAITNFDPADIITIVGQQTSYGDVFTGNGVTTNFTLSRSPGSVFGLDVSVNGVTQVPNVDYTLGGTTLSFTSAPPAVASQVLARYAEVYQEVDADAQNVRYLPAGVGAQLTNVQAKLRETVSVKDFGAVGDGVTDDTVALQAAIDYAGTNHIELIMPVGIYVTSDTLYIDQDEVMLRGTGAISTAPGASRGLSGDKTTGSVIQYTGTTCALQVSNSRSANPLTDGSNPGFIQNIQIHNLRIEVPADCANGMLVFQAAGGYFFNISIWGSQSTGGVAAGTTLLTVRGGINNIFEKIDCLGIGRYTVAVPDYSYYVNFGAQLTLGWGNDLATTTIFKRCYFHYCNIGINLSYLFEFEDCIFESCKQGVVCLADMSSKFERCWWEANIVSDITFNNSIVSVKNSRFNSYSRQQFFTTGGGVRRLQFDNVHFGTTNAAPFIFGVNPSGENIFSTTQSQEIILFNNCSFPSNTQMGFIYNNNTVNKIQIQNMQQETLTFTAASVGASATPTMNGTSGFASYTMQEAGDVIAVNIFGSAAMSAGTYNIATRINGVAIPSLSFSLVPIQSAFPFTKRIQPFLASFVKGDVISVYFNTDASFAPVNNVCFEVIVAYGPSGEV
jgi:hypothetical protein